jgi:hypothetical protein
VECLDGFGGFRRTPVGPNIFGATSAKLVRAVGCRLIRHASASCAGLALTLLPTLIFDHPTPTAAADYMRASILMGQLAG